MVASCVAFGLKWKAPPSNQESSSSQLEMNYIAIQRASKEEFCGLKTIAQYNTPSFSIAWRDQLANIK
jgi:hypothetical protein